MPPRPCRKDDDRGRGVVGWVGAAGAMRGPVGIKVTWRDSEPEPDASGEYDGVAGVVAPEVVEPHVDKRR